MPHCGMAVTTMVPAAGYTSALLPTCACTTARHKVMHHAINDSLSAAGCIHTFGWLLLRRLCARCAAAAHTGGGETEQMAAVRAYSIRPLLMRAPERRRLLRETLAPFVAPWAPESTGPTLRRHRGDDAAARERVLAGSEEHLHLAEGRAIMAERDKIEPGVAVDDDYDEELEKNRRPAVSAALRARIEARVAADPSFMGLTRAADDDRPRYGDPIEREEGEGFGGDRGRRPRPEQRDGLYAASRLFHSHEAHHRRGHRASRPRRHRRGAPRAPLIFQFDFERRSRPHRS